MNKPILKIFERLRFFIPISAVLVVTVTFLTFMSIQSNSKSKNNLLEKNLESEVKAIYRMFEREYELKNILVKNNLKTAHYNFYKSDFKIKDDYLEINALNQISKKTHKTYINRWYLDGLLLSDNHSFVDTINYLVGGTATIFQKIDSGYLRVSTNVLSLKNERAIGTYIPNSSPVVKTIENGEIYYGRAFVVNDWYITAYEPIFLDNKIIGMLYVGNKEKNLDRLKNIIHQIKIGKSGFVYTIDTKANVIIHSKLEGENWSDSTIFKQIIAKKNGTVKHKVDNKTHLISFKYFNKFDLIVIAEIIQEIEVREEKTKLVVNSIITAIISLILLSIIIFLLTYRSLKSSFKRIDKTTQALEISERKFETLFDNSSDEIYVSDLNGDFIEVNKVACETLGYSRDEFLKMNFSDIKKHGNRTKMLENIEIIKKKNEITFETEHVQKNGQIIAVEMKSRLIKYSGENVILCVARNIEERKALEKKIISTVIKTEEKERKRFAADLHDELGPVLSTIKLYTDLLKSKPIEDKKSIELIKNIDELTDLSISTTKDLQNQITPSILHEFGLSTAIQEFCNYINKTKSIKIGVKTNEYKPIKEAIIETILFQVTKELIHNTIKHAAAQNIIIELKVLNNQLILYYKDDGTGFNYNEKLGSNQGLGLNNIVNKIKTIKGKCDFNSRPKKGMFVLITIKL
ncbi:MAG: Cache 3/Cache 2 fusion domain-containing protein [Bacteroidota bacterium]|nr:Cache 3/Cache 2 fusion domain-containing protein [Bacteroidota bacterium]